MNDKQTVIVSAPGGKTWWCLPLIATLALVVASIVLCIEVHTDAPLEKLQTTTWVTSLTNREAVLTHLSKEIELANQQLVEQRTKNNLIVAFGPFLLLGALVASASALRGFQQIEPQKLVWFGVNLVVGYGCCGVLSGMVEKGIWDRMNLWRHTLCQITQLPSGGIEVPTDNVLWMYLGIFIALGLIFCGLMWLLYQMHPAKEKESPHDD